MSVEPGEIGEAGRFACAHPLPSIISEQGQVQELQINQALTNADAQLGMGHLGRANNGRSDIHLPEDRSPNRKRYRNRSSQFVQCSIGQNSRALSALLGRA
jgi:hypothetical protein